MVDFDRFPLLIFDGACGTNIQAMELDSAAWQGREGCNEYLNLSAPGAIRELHEGFVEAGAMVLETNTFGASRVVLSEYGLEHRVAEINAAAVANARSAIDGRAGVFVAGSIGPTTKLVSLGHIEPDGLQGALREQAGALVGAGVDALIIETCQDLLQSKLAVVAALEAFEQAGTAVPVFVSLTMERTGTMLVGSDIAAAAVTLEPFPIYGLGLNCATGPGDMESHMRYLFHNWDRRISCIPNQGLPEVVNGKTCYRLTPEAYARQMRRMVTEFGVSIVGGCCGTTPAHIEALVRELQGVSPRPREAAV
jgi:5-methyltetrahydrofolate--homocysteine methyltransferase